MIYRTLARAALTACALALSQGVTAQEGTSTADTPLERVKEIQEYFAQPENMVKFQFASPETQYAWQHVSQFYPTARFARAGMPTILESEIDDSLGEISFSGKEGVVRTVSEHFEAMPLDAMLVMKDGKIVYERYKTMSPHMSHITFSASKVFSSTILALLEERKDRRAEHLAGGEGDMRRLGRHGLVALVDDLAVLHHQHRVERHGLEMLRDRADGAVLPRDGDFAEAVVDRRLQHRRHACAGEAGGREDLRHVLPDVVRFRAGELEAHRIGRVG